MVDFLKYYFNICFLFGSLGCYLTGLWAYLKNKHSPINKYFLLLTLSSGIWSMGHFIMGITLNHTLAWVFCWILYGAAILIPSFYMCFIFSLIEENDKRKKEIIVSFLFAFVFLTIIPNKLFIRDVIPKFTFNYYDDLGVFGIFFALFFVSIPSYSIYRLFLVLKKSGGLKSQQLKYVILGSMFGFLGGGSTFFLSFNKPILPYFIILFVLYPFIAVYAIVKYQFLDIKIALTRAGIFIVVYTIVLGIPFWIGIKYSLWKYSTFIMLVLATLGPFIYQYLRQRAEEILLREQRRYQHALRELSKTMARIRDLDELLKVIASTIVDTVRVSFAAIYIKDEDYKSYQFKHCYPPEEKTLFQEFISLDHPLAKMLNEQKRPLLSEEFGHQQGIRLDAGLVTPCFIEDRLIGFMVVGTKPASQAYVPDDVLVFETLSYSSSLAIENSIFWKEIEERQRQARVQEMNLFSYSLAHEIDNPMAVIIGHADLLKKYFLKENLPEEKQKEAATDLDYILEAAHRVSGMVDAIQDLGKRTTGEFQPLRLEEVIESFCKLYEPIFKNEAVYFA
jgi:signal transduction histidine kinase